MTTDDFTTPAGVGYETGSPGVIPGLGKFALQYLDPKPASVAIVYADNPAGTAAAQSLLKPVFDANGVTDVKLVPVSDTATAADAQSAMTVAGAEHRRRVHPAGDGAELHQRLRRHPGARDQPTGRDDRAVLRHADDRPPGRRSARTIRCPNGWYFGGYGYSYFAPDFDSGMQTYVTKIQEYGEKASGAATLEYTGFGGPMFANLLTVVKLSNEIGVDNLSFETVDAAIRGFTGPMMLQVGPLDCGSTIILGLPIFISVCAGQMGVQQYLDGEWISIADGLNGEPIDVADPLVG